MNVKPEVGEAEDRQQLTSRLVMDVIDRVPRTGERGIYLKQQLKDKLVEHRQYIGKYGEDLPEIRDWKWGDRR